MAKAKTAKSSSASAKSVSRGKAPAKATATPEQIAFFEKSIRPVLVKECYSCHATTAEKIRGGLTLDTREGMLKGGESGDPAIVPGDVEKSLLIKAVRYSDKDLQMPPKKQLAREQVVVELVGGRELCAGHGLELPQNLNTMLVARRDGGRAIVVPAIVPAAVAQG